MQREDAAGDVRWRQLVGQLGKKEKRTGSRRKQQEEGAKGGNRMWKQQRAEAAIGEGGVNSK